MKHSLAHSSLCQGVWHKNTLYLHQSAIFSQFTYILPFFPVYFNAVQGEPLHPALGIDHGEARIGLAITDAVGILAHPLETIQVKTSDPIARIKEIVAQRGIQQLVIGLPLRMDGTEGTAADKIRKFAGLLTNEIDLPLDFMDERLTTVAAAEKLHQAGKNAKKQKSIIDQAAAVEILNLWLQQTSTDFPIYPDEPFI